LLTPALSIPHVSPSHIFILLFLLFHKSSNWGRRPARLNRGLLETGKKKYIYIYTYLISGDEVRLYREIIQLHLCSFHLHGENKKNESSA